MKRMYRIVVMMVAVVALLILSVPVHASKMDSRIESSAKKSYVFKTYLKGDDIKIQSKDGVVTLTGTVAEESPQIIGPGDRSRPPRCQECGQQAGSQR